ncbi:transcription activator acu-15 [Fusarium albosuccineum]|uniref:Transcription activator acu-15 n=1 Tax=Fusarium albosuccineum TaxID=1237068 RepID=A0A8H4L9U7_9HYPO|nr:transcription activator acu-15 [Fusarium albosuccineum]
MITLRVSIVEVEVDHAATAAQPNHLRYLKHMKKSDDYRTECTNQVSQVSTQSATPSQHEEVNQERKIKCWSGIQLRPARSPHSAWFGPSSLYYFTHRLSNFLSAQSDHMLIHLTSNLELADRPAASQDSSNLLAPLGETNNNAVYLGPVQEEYFMNLFWQTYHTSLFAILDEAAFKKDYQTLYVDMPAGQPRKPSALVDIIVAMCMQYGTSTLPSGHQGSIVEDNDATIAGRWHYRRAQALLACEMESPTISTLQCHLLCVIYVCGGSFHNMADSICGLAVRTAYMLGLHLDPSPSMPEPERQIRRRLWWAVYVLDTKVGMKLGRPFLIHDSQVMPDLPSDTLDASIHSGSTFAPIGDNATWLSFNLHHVKLYKTFRKDLDPFNKEDRGVAHAIELTKITQQALSLTSLLDGWHEAFQWQWNAGMTLAGFVLCNPQSQSTPAARNAIEVAVSVLDTFGASFGTGAKAAAIVRALCPRVQSTISDIESGTIGLLGAEYPEIDQEVLTQDFLLDGNTADLDAIGGPTFDLMDMAVDVDFWADMGML